MVEQTSGAGETICAACGKTNLPGMRFCGFCGAPLPVTKSEVLTEAPPVSAVPEVVTVPKSVEPVTAKPAIVPPPSVLPQSGQAGAGRPPAKPLGSEQDRERERLLSQANAFRVKGQITDARETLQKALLLAESLPMREQAPLYEQLGDLLLIEEKFDDALAAYTKAREFDPKRVVTERKFADASLQKAQATGKLSMSEALLRGDSLADLLASGELNGAGGRRNAGLAMFLSMIVPGFGQFYNGQLIKALILASVFVISLLVLMLSPERNDFFRDVTAIFALKTAKAGHPISPLTIFFALTCFGSWLFSLVDAPFSANKIRPAAEVVVSKVDKSGWEV